MTAVTIFRSGSWSVRSTLADGEPLFVAADVARALGYRDAHNLVRRLDADEQGYSRMSTPGGEQGLLMITEAGVYKAIFGSQLDSAKEFQRWVTHKVLPALRRTGTYTVAPAEPAFPVPATYAEALQLAADQARQLEQITERVAELEPAAEAWQALASADGDLSVRDAALILQRDGIDIGATRLFGRLRVRAVLLQRPASTRICSSPNAVRTRTLRRRCARPARCASSASSTRSTPARSSASGAASPNVNAAACAATG